MITSVYDYTMSKLVGKIDDVNGDGIELEAWLPKGQYYIGQKSGIDDTKGEYSFCINYYETVGYNEKSYNNIYQDSKKILYEETNIGSIVMYDPIDWYSAYLAKPTNTVLDVQTDIPITIKMYDYAMTKNLNTFTIEPGVSSLNLGMLEGYLYYFGLYHNSENEYGEYQITFHDSNITDIIFSSHNNTLNTNRQLDLEISLIPTYASKDELIWTSSDEYVAKVVNGTVFGLQAGVVVIRATSKYDETIYSECVVNVEYLEVPEFGTYVLPEYALFDSWIEDKIVDYQDEVDLNELSTFKLAISRVDQFWLYKIALNGFTNSEIFDVLEVFEEIFTEDEINEYTRLFLKYRNLLDEL